MPNPQHDNSQVDQELPFLSHLIELRDRLIRVVVAILAIFLLLFSFANDLYALIAKPLLVHLPAGGSMIATEVASPFLTPFKLAMVASIFLAMPYILYQGWAFIAPGLYRNEKMLALPLLVSSIVLFYAGMAFAYFVVFPMVFGFLTGIAPQGVSVMTDITKYLDFVLTMFFAFGAAFEVPVATIILVAIGVTTPESLAAKRSYIIVAAFVIGMILTPPDVISQTLLAIPMLILFEAGLFFSRIVVRKRAEAEAERDREEEVAESQMTDAEMEAEFDKAIAAERLLIDRSDAAGKDGDAANKDKA